MGKKNTCKATEIKERLDGKIRTYEVWVDVHCGPFIVKANYMEMSEESSYGCDICNRRKMRLPFGNMKEYMNRDFQSDYVMCFYCYSEVMDFCKNLKNQKRSQDNSGFIKRLIDKMRRRAV